jgi:2'-5' RNA ligase
MAESALLIRVAEAEPLVGSLRDRFDPTATVGVPAHITLLYPFMSPERVTTAVLASLRDACSSVARFRFHLARVGRFPETTYLAPNPEQPFVALAELLYSKFPEYPPYGGRFEKIVPHLTVADKDAAGASTAEHELSERMRETGGIQCECQAIELWKNDSGLWKYLHSFELST